MAKLRPAAILIVCLLMSMSLTAQDIDERCDKILSFPSRFFHKTNEKYTRLENRIVRQSKRALQQLATQEKKLQKKVYARDSAVAKEIFDSTLISYQAL